MKVIFRVVAEARGRALEIGAREERVQRLFAVVTLVAKRT
jgi:hypothetical protein